jgi:hypothetical protein
VVHNVDDVLRTHQLGHAFNLMSELSSLHIK